MAWADAALRSGAPMAPATVDSLASLQHGAVGIAGEHRHVPGDHRDHRLVEQRDTLRDAFETDQSAHRALSGLACEIAIYILAGELRGLI